MTSRLLSYNFPVLEFAVNKCCGHLRRDEMWSAVPWRVLTLGCRTHRSQRNPVRVWMDTIVIRDKCRVLQYTFAPRHGVSFFTRSCERSRSLDHSWASFFYYFFFISRALTLTGVKLKQEAWWEVKEVVLFRLRQMKLILYNQNCEINL